MNGLNIAAYDDTMGVVFDYRSRFRVSLAWGRRRSHLCIGKSVATPEMMLKKFFLKDFMATSATLCQWQCGGTSLRAQCCCIRVFMISEHLLSRMWHCGVIPVSLIILRRMRYALFIAVSVMFCIDVTSVALLLISTMTMIYLYPCWEWKGERPVWSEYVLCFASYNLKHISRAIFPRSIVMFVPGSGVALGLVESKSVGIGLDVLLVFPQFWGNVCRYFQWRGEASLCNFLRILT